MRHPWSLLRYAVLALVIATGLFAAPKPAEASHYRYGHLTWRATGPTSVQFSLTIAARRGPDAMNTTFYPGSGPGGLLQLGDTFTEFIGATRLETGDGTFIGGFQGLRFIVVAVDPGRNYVIARALDPITNKDRIDHTYATPNNNGVPWRAEVGGCCRISSLRNNPDSSYRVYSDIDLSVNRASAVSALPAIVPGPQNGFSFLVPAADPEQHRLVYRLADQDEPIDSQFVGFETFFQPPGATIDPNTGIYTVPAGLAVGLWSTHIIIEEYDINGNKVGQVGLEFLFQVLGSVSGNAPQFVVPPTPADGIVLTASPGKLINFSIVVADPDGGNVTLNTTGIPIGARQIPTLPTTSGNGTVTLAFSWTPTQEDLGAYSITYTAEDASGNFTITSVSIRVILPPKIIEPNGGEAYFPGDPVNIRWQSPGFPRSQGVRIELSRDGGRTFPTLITPNTPDDGEFAWTATLPLSKQCRIRVSNIADPGDAGVSDANFVIIEGDDPERCTAGPAIPIADNSATWTESPLPFPQDFIIRGLRVRVDITHPFTGDLHVELVHPDGTTAILHRQTGEGNDNLQVIYGAGAAYTTPDEPLTKFYGKHSQGTWKLRVRDLIPGDVGQINRWCLQVIGLTPGTFKITSPNGGETLAVGSKHTATWQVNNITGIAGIQLSRDGGETYTTIGQVPASDGSFEFTVTAPITNRARLRVLEIDEPVLADTSDADFSIALPFLQILTPQGGDRVSVGQPTEIKWSGTPKANSVKIEFSKNSGQTWTTLAGSAPDTGSYLWTPTSDDDTTGGRLRITANTGPVRFDSSDSDFIVQTPAIIVNSPNGGETWYTLTTRTITWQSVGVSGPVRIELSRDRGTTWEVIIPSTPDDGSESWAVGGLPTDEARIRVTSIEEESLADSSDASFRIARMNVQLTAPNGGERWGTGSVQDITWSTDGVTGTVDLSVSRDGGASFTTIASDVPNTGVYRWTVTGPSSAQAIVKVKAHDFAVDDASNGIFSIIGATITVGSPNGGETLRVGQDYTLVWSSQGLGGNVRIELSRNGGGAWETLFTSTANDGSETWRVAGADTTNARLRVTSLDNTDVSDSSDSLFSILSPGFTVVTPNGGESWVVDSVQTIRWDSQAVTGNARIEITRNGGLSWQTIIDNTENDGVADWTVTAPGGTNCRIRVSAVDNVAVRDESDGPFTIVQPALRVVTPNGGQNLLVGSTQTIVWSSAGIDSGEDVVIDVSYDGGLSWNHIAETANDGSHPWQVSGGPTTSARVRVSLSSNNTISDSSDSSFRISVPDIRITGPARKVVWKRNTRKTITWTGTSLGHGTVDIQLSRNNGRTWETILEGTANDGSATWTVALPAAAKAKLRIIWNPLPTVQDTTRFVLVIRK